MKLIGNRRNHAFFVGRFPQDSTPVCFPHHLIPAEMLWKHFKVSLFIVEETHPFCEFHGTFVRFAKEWCSQDDTHFDRESDQREVHNSPRFLVYFEQEVCNELVTSRSKLLETWDDVVFWMKLHTHCENPRAEWASIGAHWL